MDRETLGHPAAEQSRLFSQPGGRMGLASKWRLGQIGLVGLCFVQVCCRVLDACTDLQSTGGHPPPPHATVLCSMLLHAAVLVPREEHPALDPKPSPAQPRPGQARWRVVPMTHMVMACRLTAG
jgi:hypothetical protein